MCEPRILIIGHSHLHAIAHAALTRPEFSTIQLLEPIFNPAIQDGKINNALAEVIRSAPFEAFVLSLSGNDYATLGLVEHPRPFDFTLPGGLEPAAENRETVPFALVKRHFERQNIYTSLFMSLFVATVEAPTLLLEPPPPIGDEEHLRKYGGIFREAMNERGVMPAKVRRKLWLVQSMVYEESALKAGAQFIRAPQDAFDENGMLDRRAWSLDATHANPWYGELVLEQINESLQVLA